MFSQGDCFEGVTVRQREQRVQTLRPQITFGGAASGTAPSLSLVPIPSGVNEVMRGLGWVRVSRLEPVRLFSSGLLKDSVNKMG